MDVFQLLILLGENAHTKRYERKSENSGRFGSSGASDKRRSGTSDKNQPRQPRVSASGKREHNEKSHKENVATPSSEIVRVPKKRKISPPVDLATPVGIATSRTACWNRSWLLVIEGTCP